MDAPFFINARFKVEEAVNTVTDTTTGVVTRLESRIMKLLMLLSDHQGKVVTRQQIVTDVWDDYGNADEGLNQAISFLRKILVDQNKELIRTIPKKGYMLTVAVSAGPEADMIFRPAVQPVDPQTPRRRYTVILVVSILLVVAAAVYFLLAPGLKADFKVPAEPPGATIDTLYQYKEMKEALELQKNCDSNNNHDTFSQHQ